MSGEHSCENISSHVKRSRLLSLHKLNRKPKQTTTTATKTPPNKQVNELNNSCARAL